MWISPLVCSTESPSSIATLSMDHDSIDDLISGRDVMNFSTRKPYDGWTPSVLIHGHKVMENANHDREKAMPDEFYWQL